MVYVLAALVLSIARVYFVVTYDVIGELAQAKGSKVIRPRIETVFLASVAVTYIPLAAWTIKSNNKIVVPSMVTIVGSTSLIILYVASITVGNRCSGGHRINRHD